MFRDGEIAGRDFAAWHWDWEYSASQDAPDDIIAYLPEPETPGDTVRENPYYVYVRGLARMRLNPQSGETLEVWLARRMREIRNGARVLAPKIPENPDV
jgi:hypothetical protein